MGGLSELQKGDYVRIQGQESIGEVVQIKVKHATVAFQAMEISIPLTRLEKAHVVGQGSLATPSSQPASRILNLEADAFSAFNPEIDLHGMLVHEAISAIDRWIDRASVVGHKQLKVIHGKGTGALRSAIRTYVQSHSQVKRVIARHPYPGGEGVTWLEIY